MLYKIGKKLFSLLLDGINLLRVSMVFLSFFTIIYWLISLEQPQSVSFFSPFFNSVLDFVHLFYQRRVVLDEKTVVDYSFLIFSIMLLIGVWALKFAIEFIENLELSYDELYLKSKKIIQEAFNIELEAQSTIKTNEKRKFIALISFLAQEKDLELSYNAKTEEEIQEVQQEILNSFTKNCISETKFQKKLRENYLILYFEGLENLDEIFFELNKKFNDLKWVYAKENWDVFSLCAVESYETETEIAKKYEILKLLINSKYKNKIVCTSNFKHQYLQLNKAAHYLHSRGVFDLGGTTEVFEIRLRENNNT